MSTPNNASPVPNHQFYPPQPQHQQHQQHQQQQQYGQPGPGPNTMAHNRSSIAPHQLQLLQQVTAAARSQGMNLSPQQITMVVSMLESQGGNGNPQMLMNALRSLGHGQGQMPMQPGQGMGQMQPGQNQGQMQGQMQGQGQGQMQPGQGQGSMQMQPSQGQGQGQKRPGSSHGPSGGQGQGMGQPPLSQHALQQQRIQQMIQNNHQSSPTQNHAQAQQYPGMQVRAGTPGQMDPRQSMPPPGPPVNASPRPGPPPGMPNQSRFTLSAQQQAMISQQQQTIMSNPQFQALPHQQQQHHLGAMHRKFIEHFMAEAERSQGPPPSSEPSTHTQRQSTPQPGPGTPQNQNNGPPSGIPPHMAPPRPGSAASQHAGSPHHAGSPMAMSTPPPSNQYSTHQPPNTVSPVPSAHSQAPSAAQQYPTPQPHAQPPPHSQSPLAAHQNGPSPRHQSTPDINNPIRPSQPPVIPPGGYTPQQQQQMAAAMNIFGQAVQAQGQGGVPGPSQPPVRPGQSPANNTMSMGMNQPRPPPINVQGINPQEFPFDYRLIPVINQTNDPRLHANNPYLANSANQARQMIDSGLVQHEMLQKMQQFYAAMWKMSQGRPLPSTGGSGPSSIPPHLERNFLPGQGPPVGANGTPNRRDSVGSVRPPPPHIVPESPAVEEARPSSSRGPAAPIPTETAMPPPTWIPGQPTPSRPPPDTRPQPGSSGSAPSSLPVKEWEGHLRLDLPITQITSLPEETDDPIFDGQLPPISEEEIKSVMGWMEVDKAFASGMVDRKKAVQKKMVKWARNNDMDTPWWSVRKGERYMPPRARLQILFPRDKDAQRMRKSHKGRRYTRYTPAQLKAMADVEDHIIPIRLDIEHDHFRLRDTFMWNVSDTVISPEMFAVSICDDFGVSAHSFVPKIVAIINERVNEYRDQVAPAEQPCPSSQGKLDLDNVEGKRRMEIFRRAQSDEDDQPSPISDEIKTDPGDDEPTNVKMVTWDDQVSNRTVDRPMTVDELEGSVDYKDVDEELRLLIKVEILIGNQNLTDTFEWDLNSLVTPEEFALSYCTELGLSGEFITALAHDIHEQIITQKRCLFLTGHIVGSGLDLDDEVKTAFLPPIRNVLRNEQVAMSTYTPIFATFTDEDIQTIERERERDSKRKKRATRARRGVILPDREPFKTQRTLLNPIGANGTIAQAATELAATAPVTSSRRAAAIAAQANINLLAQDLPLPQPPTPPPTNHPYKVTKTRGRGSGRGGHSRNSPASFPTREGSVFGDHHQTPLPSSALKRSYREETGSEINSPAPNKMARMNHTSSPTLVNESQSQGHQVKMEHPSFQAPPPPIISQSQDQLPQSTSMGEIKRKSEDVIDPRDTKSVKLDTMLGQGQLDNSNPQSRSDSPSSISYPPLPPAKQDRFMPSSPSNSDTGSESSDSDYGAPKKARPSIKPQKSITPASTSVPLNSSPQFMSSSSPLPPKWVVSAHTELKRKYPQDAFNVIPKPRPVDQPAAPQEWRMKCLDCPGRIYSLGPAETLNNFEVHLKNRGHRENVQNRVSKSGAAV